MKKTDIETPALILDIEVLKKNIETMADYLKDKPAKLRPHIKCHKTPVIAHMQIKAGAKGVMTAKLGEAEVMTDAGIADVVIANQVVQDSKLERLAGLNRYGKVSVAVDNSEVAERLSNVALRRGVSVGVVEEIDIGLSRCGVLPGKPAVDLAKKIANLKGLIFEGITGWEGHVAFIKDFRERREQCNRCYHKLIECKRQILEAGIDVETVGAGGTTTFNLAAEYPGVNEIEAGSYVFMSLTHSLEGIPFQQALTVLTTVTSKPARDRIIVDGGVKTFCVAEGNPKVKGFEGLEVHELHMEHGILRLSNPNVSLQVGDMIEFVPAYADTAINLHDKVYITKGDQVETTWGIQARGRTD